MIINEKIHVGNDIIYNLSINNIIEDLLNKRKDELIKIKCNIKIKDSVIQYNYKINRHQYYLCNFYFIFE